MNLTRPGGALLPSPVVDSHLSSQNMFSFIVSTLSNCDNIALAVTVLLVRLTMQSIGTVPISDPQSPRLLFPTRSLTLLPTLINSPNCLLVPTRNLILLLLPVRSLTLQRPPARSLRCYRHFTQWPVTNYLSGNIETRYGSSTGHRFASHPLRSCPCSVTYSDDPLRPHARWGFSKETRIPKY